MVVYNTSGLPPERRLWQVGGTSSRGGSTHFSSPLLQQVLPPPTTCRSCSPPSYLPGDRQVGSSSSRSACPSRSTACPPGPARGRAGSWLRLLEVRCVFLLQPYTCSQWTNMVTILYTHRFGYKRTPYHQWCDAVSLYCLAPKLTVMQWYCHKT